MKINKEIVTSFLLVPFFFGLAVSVVQNCEKPRFSVEGVQPFCESDLLFYLAEFFILLGVGSILAGFIFIWRSREPKKFSLLNQEKGK